MGAIILGPVIQADPQPALANPSEVGRLLDASHVSLAREIVQGIFPLAEILQSYGFSDDSDPRWLALKEHPEFLKVLHEAAREWNGVDSTPKRIRAKALASVEASIPTLHGIIHDPTVKVPDRVEGMKTMMRLAGVAENNGAGKNGQGGGGFNVTIKIGQGQQVRLSATPERPVIDADSGADTESSALAETVTLSALEGV